MRFVAIYHNDSGSRTKALQFIYGALNQGMDLGHQSLTLPAVQTNPNWPDIKTMANLPIQMQCEWMEYTEDKQLKTLRLLVIDAETVTIPEEKLDKSPSYT